ncbi:MAG: hypothetical protein ACYDCO_14260 [Armatimonadota bacterium]
MAKKIQGFLAGSSYAPSVSSDEGFLRRGCEAILDANISSGIVVLEDGSIWVGHPTFTLDPVAPELITRIIRERLMQDDFGTRPVRAAVRARLREIEGKSEKEQLEALSQLLQEHAEHFLVEAGTGMDDAMRQREADLDARCRRRAA